MTDATSLVLTGAAVGAKAAVLLAAAALVDLVAPRRMMSAAARHLMFTLAIAAVALLPALDWSLLRMQLAIPVIPAAMDPLRASPSVADAGFVGPGRGRATDPVASDARSAPAAGGDQKPLSLSGGPDVTPPLPSWPTAVVALYAAGALLLLIRLLAEHRHIRTLARGAQSPMDANWAAESRDIAAGFRVARPVALLAGDDLTMPLTWGVLRPRVLLPASARQWSPSRRRAVLLHELAHVARNDCLTQSIAAVVCALYWPLPMAWWAARRLRVERELACDDRALEAGLASHDYASHLLSIARAYAPAPRLTLVVSMAGMSPLEARLRAAIDIGRSRRAPTRREHLLAAAAMLTLLLPLAAMTAKSATAATASTVAVTPPPSITQILDGPITPTEGTVAGLGSAQPAAARSTGQTAVTSARIGAVSSRTDTATGTESVRRAVDLAQAPIPASLVSLGLAASLAALDSLEAKMAPLERMVETELPVSTEVTGDVMVRVYRNGIVVVDSGGERTFHVKP